MATRIRVTRVHNPRRSYRRTRVNRRRRRTTNRRSYRNRRRNMTDKQIKHFGTKKQRAALKAKNRRRRTVNRSRTRRRYSRSNVWKGWYYGGKFHPARASPDYDPEEVGEPEDAGTYGRTPMGKRYRKAYAAEYAKTQRKRAKRGKAKGHRKRTNRRRRSNPMLVEFGTLNPRGGGRRTYRRRRATNVARRYRRRRSATNRRRHNRRRYNRRRNPVMHHRRRRVYHRRRHNAGRRSYRNRRRNPVIFGQSSAKEIAFMIAGGLVGVAATKYLPTLLPSGLSSTLGAGGGIMSVGVTVAGAFLAGWVGGMWDRAFGDAVLFGGLMQAGSQLLSMFLNPNPLALSGLGDIVATRGFVVPQNPVLQPIAAPAPNKGMGAFRGAFGYRR